MGRDSTIQTQGAHSHGTVEKACKHCGTPFRPTPAEPDFCCQGCGYVHQLIQGQELGHFYDLKGGRPIPPAGSKVFYEQNLDWLNAWVAEAEAQAQGSVASGNCRLTGISCIGCVWLIEKLFGQQNGSVSIDIRTQTGELTLSWDRGTWDCQAFAKALRQLGYGLEPENNADAGTDAVSKGLVYRIGICGFLVLNTMLFTLPGYLGMEADFTYAALFRLLAATFATFSFLIGGSYFIHRAWQALRHRVLHMDLPIALGICCGYAGSLVGWMAHYEPLVYFDFVSTFVFLMLVGRWVQENAIARNRKHLQRQNPGPGTVRLLRPRTHGEGNEKADKQIDASEIKESDLFSLGPGGINPVTSDLLVDKAVVSLEWINGESEPVVWPRTAPVPAGAILLGMESVNLRAREDWANGLLAKLLTPPKVSPRQAHLQRILAHYTGIVIIIAILGSAAWLALSLDPLKALQVGISILIVSCPCAIGVALPLADELAISALRRRGLFVKNDSLWARLHKVKTIIFDKTGTLSLDVPRLRNPSSINRLPEDWITPLFALVRDNRHPTARSLKQALLQQNPHLSAPSHSTSDEKVHLQETVSHGVYFVDSQGKTWSLGRADWAPFHELSGKVSPHDAQLVLRLSGKALAAFVFAEDIRDDAASAIAALKKQGLAVSILSGDSAERVRKMASVLELPQEHCHARCTPESKAEWIEQHAPGQALMVGDGANDRLAFDSALCTGTPVVDRSILEGSADFYFFGRSLRAIPTLFETASRRRKTVQLVFAAAVAYNIAAVAVCLAGFMHPLIAAIAMPASSLVTLAMTWWGMERDENQAGKTTTRFATPD